MPSSPADVALVAYPDLNDRTSAHFVTSMEEYKACEAILSDCVGDGDDCHYDDCTGYSDCDDPNNYDDCRDCHLSIHDFDEPDDYKLYHDLHGSDGCGEYCVSHDVSSLEEYRGRDVIRINVIRPRTDLDRRRLLRWK